MFFLLFILVQLWTVRAQTLYHHHHHHRTTAQYTAVNYQSATQSSSTNSIWSSFKGSHYNDMNRSRKRAAKVNREKSEFLNAHNLIRRRVGEPLLSWDRYLARYARAWAKKRADDCRLVHSNGPYGENIFWGGRNHWRPRQVVKMWADEYKYYDTSANTCESQRMCGHYTQIVWRESTKVGCARAKCSNGGIYIICVYNPPGNYEGENPFGEYKDQTGIVRSEAPMTTVADPPFPAAKWLQGGM